MPRKSYTSCQLCAEAISHFKTPQAVVTIANVRICAKHQRLLSAIAHSASSGEPDTRRRHPVVRLMVGRASA